MGSRFNVSSERQLVTVRIEPTTSSFQVERSTNWTMGAGFAIGKKYAHVYSAGPSAIFSNTIIKTIFTSGATANRNFMTLI